MKSYNYTAQMAENESEDDWETTGLEELNGFHEEYTRNKRIIHVRDKLNNILDLLILCREALSNSELIKINETVINVLYFYVENQIKLAEKELSQI